MKPTISRSFETSKIKVFQLKTSMLLEFGGDLKNKKTLQSENPQLSSSLEVICKIGEWSSLRVPQISAGLVGLQSFLEPVLFLVNENMVGLS